MNVQDLELQLKSEFELKAFCDLSSISTSPNALIKMLDSVYQSSYNHHDRIVFYTSHCPSEEMVKHLYQTTNFLDIGNCFVLLCGPPGLENMIVELCQAHSIDPVPFQFKAVALQPTQPLDDRFVLPSTICSIPWNNVELNFNGDMSPCCMSRNLIYGNIKNTTLKDAFHSEGAKKLRKDMLEGRKPQACESCWKVEEKNLTSIRMHNINRTKKLFLLDHIDAPKISTMDIKFNNTCNFKCRICNSDSSSAFAIEESKFRNIPLIVQDNWGESEQFLDQVIESLPDLNNIDMYGGEPFLIKKFSKVLKLAIDQGHADHIRLHYNSNGSVWPENFLQYWPHFKQVDIHFSIDAVGKQFELQRGGNWADVESNILRLKKLNMPNLSINIMPTISAMNIFYIDQVYDWATEHGFNLFVSHVRGKGLEIKYLTKQAKEIISEKYKNHPWSELQNLLAMLKELPDDDGQEFCDKIKWFDTIRQENFADSHPEIAKAMGYSV